MFLAKKLPAYFCLLMLLFVVSSAGYTATSPLQFNITVTQKGPGTVSPPGKVSVASGQDQLFTFQPNTGYEVSSVKVDGRSVSPTPVGSYTVTNVTKSRTLSVTFAKKTVEVHLLNQSLQMGSMQPSGSLIKVPYDGSQTFTARPKKGYLAILRVDGQDETKSTAVNQPVSVTLKNITRPRTIDVRYEAEPNEAVTAIVHINAKDPNGLPLHYRWKVSEGQIENFDTDTVQWALPVGPGVHFANVLVSNNQGGYAARRIAVVSDKLGTSPPAIQATGQDFEPVAAFGKSYAYNSTFMVADATDQAQSSLLTRFVYLRDFVVLDTVFNGELGDAQGRVISTYLNPFNGGGDVAGPFSSLATHPHTDTNPTDYIVGSAQLADGSLCGIDDKFHGVDVAATATAITLDEQGNPLPLGNSVTVKANAYGDYALPWLAEATHVLVKCEDASFIAAIDTNRIAAKAVFLKTGQPIITPKVASMTAKINNRNVGIFLPPELKEPSDLHPSGEKFLGFKGIDTQQQACEYYKSIGAVQGCDSQGNPNGAITFDDWKRKVQMEPYATQAGKEVDATYVNRIDLNLTRRHHAISYDDQPGLVSISAGDGFSCGIRADESVVCWGWNYAGITAPPSGRFSQVSAGSSHVCAIKSDDNTVICWGDTSGQESPLTDSFSQIAAGSNYTCGIKTADNSVACWGWMPDSPPSESFTQISVGRTHVCGIKTDHKLACWGSIDQAVIPDEEFNQVSVGDGQTCAIKSADGTVACWGNVDLTTIDSTTIHNGSSLFEFYKCADKLDGSGTTCWVQNPPPAGSFKQVSVGAFHACGLTIDNTLVCWGDNTIGPEQATPPVGNFNQVDVSSFYSCAFKTDGTVACWGDNALGQSSPPDFKHRVAAYVCNHLGPKNSTRGALEWAISNALNDRNQVACVAMDFQSHNGGNPYVRFYVFTANGQLSLSINLDGRQEKYVPGTCVACHGGDKYDGHFPGDGTGSPDVGAHFLPYDVGNFLFSARPGFTKADQQAAIHQLNNIVLKTNATPIERTLINSWYKPGSDILDENYWPDDWQKAAKDPDVAKVYPGVDVEHVYKNVNARYCRTCHVALNRDGMGGGRAFDNPEHFDIWANILHHETYDANWNVIDSVPYVAINNDALPLTVCGNSPFLHDNHTMPNSLVTFNLLWNDKKAVTLLQSMMSKHQQDVCKSETPDPKLGIRH